MDDMHLKTPKIISKPPVDLRPCVLNTCQLGSMHFFAFSCSTRLASCRNGKISPCENQTALQAWKATWWPSLNIEYIHLISQG